MSPPLVTCVLCAYDYERYVERAVRSALEQTGLPDGAVEVVVVDDGSTDGTPRILAGFGDAITVIRQPNQGPAIATAAGIATARGRYVSLLDADDEWTSDRLVRVLDVLERDPAVGLVHGDMQVIDDDGAVAHASMFAWQGLTPASGDVLFAYLVDNQATTSAITLRTDLAQAIPAPPAWAWCRDWWLAAHVAATHEIAVVDGPLARYRLHGANHFAFGAGDASTVHLWERSVRVRRILLRTLDLSRVSLAQLAGVWSHHVSLAGHVAQARGLDPQAVLALDGVDRAEAARRMAEAFALRDTDPQRAGRLAVAALAADPANADAGALLGDLLRDERIADLARGRRTLLDAAYDPAAVPARLARWQELERDRLAVGTPPPTPADRDASLDAVAEAMNAIDRRDDIAAIDRLIRALTLQPADAHAHALLGEAVARLTGRPAPVRDRATREALTGRRPLQPADARAFVAIADVDELLADPTLLTAWAESIDGDDDATLAVVAPDRDAASAREAVLGLLGRCGIGADDDRDLALIAGPTDATALARGAHARWTRIGALDGPLGGLPAVGDREALRVLAERRWSHDGLGGPISVAIKVCAPSWAGAERWGDVHFARAIADELRRRGHAAIVQVIPEWDDADGRACDVALHLRGLDAYVPHPGQPSVLWCISHPDLVTPAECDRFDIAFSASPRHAAGLSAHTAHPVGVLAQATDPAVFFPQPDPDHARELVFVGNSRGVFRDVLARLLPTDRDLAVWGQGWEPFVDARHLAGEHLANDAVRRAYSSAAIVLNDHWADMREQGLVSNRVFDALACGATVLSDDLPELAALLGGHVLTYTEADPPGAMVERTLGDRRDGGVARAAVLAEHTFARRVDVLLAAVASRVPVGVR